MFAKREKFSNFRNITSLIKFQCCNPFVTKSSGVAQDDRGSTSTTNIFQLQQVLAKFKSYSWKKKNRAKCFIYFTIYMLLDFTLCLYLYFWKKQVFYFYFHIWKDSRLFPLFVSEWRTRKHNLYPSILLLRAMLLGHYYQKHSLIPRVWKHHQNWIIFWRVLSFLHNNQLFIHFY